MTQPFDTGLVTPQRTAIRNAIVALLARPYLRLIGVLPRPLRDANDEELALLAEMTRGRAPCLLVSLGKKSYKSVGVDGLSYTAAIDVVIYVMSSNGRDDMARLAGDIVSATSLAADPGVETMLEHVEHSLLGASLDVPTTYTFTPTSEDEFVTLEDFAVWESRWEIGVEIDINDELSATANNPPTGTALSISSADDLIDADPANPIVTAVTELDTP